MKAVIVYLVVSVLFLAGMIVLQVFLAKRESKWAGLVLPIILLILSFLYPLNMTVPIEGVSAGFVFQMLAVWLLANIPTIIFRRFISAAALSSASTSSLKK